MCVRVLSLILSLASWSQGDRSLGAGSCAWLQQGGESSIWRKDTVVWPEETDAGHPKAVTLEYCTQNIHIKLRRHAQAKCLGVRSIPAQDADTGRRKISHSENPS